MATKACQRTAECDAATRAERSAAAELPWRPRCWWGPARAASFACAAGAQSQPDDLAVDDARGQQRTDAGAHRKAGADQSQGVRSKHAADARTAVRHASRPSNGLKAARAKTRVDKGAGDCDGQGGAARESGRLGGVGQPAAVADDTIGVREGE